MQQLLNFPLKEPARIKGLRNARTRSPVKVSARVDLGVALSEGGCTYEAAQLLRPIQSHWKSTPVADRARAALDAQTWWNKHWKAFAQLKRGGNSRGALALLGDRSTSYWDLPPLLAHLGEIAASDAQLDLSDHLYQRLLYLSHSDLPKINLVPFEYVAQAGLIENLMRRGDAELALRRHRKIKPNSGNVLAHEIQGAILLVATERFEQAMVHAAQMLVTANGQRSGYGKSVRLDFLNKAVELKRLRARTDWRLMKREPAKFVQQNKKYGG